MLFNSFSFLLFFPLVTLAYFIIPQKIKPLFLLLASYYFYACWSVKYLLLLMVSTLITYASGLLIENAKTLAKKKLWVALSFISNLGILFTFKYFLFAMDTIANIAKYFHIAFNEPQFSLVLPVGISFYIFQALSYTMDVYRDEIEAEKNVIKYALFVSFFPQLVAGPIERSSHLLPQMSEEHYFDYDRVKNGLLLMIWGFFEKLVIADRAAILSDQVFNNFSQYSSFEVVIAAVCFTMQIYTDFAGYSHIAIGAAQVLGFELMDNFRQPYFAESIGDFWRRWHISLSSWLRDYLYIPLGGNRKGTLRKCANLMIVFLASGLWHGAAWHYVVWGGIHGVYQIAEILINKIRNFQLKKPVEQKEGKSIQLLRRIVTFSFVTLAWVFFRANCCGDAIGMIARMFTQWDPWALFDGTIYQLGLSRPQFWLLILAISVLFWVDCQHEKGRQLRKELLEKNAFWTGLLVWIGVLAIFIFGIYGPVYEAAAFIYFQF